jgi:hypothetical protein
MNCKKYNKKAKFQKMTWLPNIPTNLQYYHVIGDASDAHFDDTERILWVPTPDDYNSLPKKVVAAYAATLARFPNITYIFKTDDDQILVNPRFFDVLDGILSKPIVSPFYSPPFGGYHYGGFVVDVKRNYMSQYYKLHPELPANLPIIAGKYCSGRFYFLSRDAATDVVSKRTQISAEYLEDYAIGHHMAPQLKINILNLATNNYFTDIEQSDFPKWVADGRV